jgi:hypothetical protein
MRRLVVVSSFALVAAVACSSIRSSPVDSPVDGGSDAAFDASSSPFQVVRGGLQGETLTAVWGADGQTIFAVGTNGLHLDYFASNWQRVQDVMGRDYTAVWGTSSTDVYAVGTNAGDGRGVIEHFDGRSWRDEYIADTSLHGIWGAGQLVLAVGGKGMIYGKQQGTVAWAPRLSNGLPANPNVAQGPDSPILWSISGNGPNDFAMAADIDRVFHYEGNGNFENLDPSVDRSMVFRTVWAPPGPRTSVFFGTNHFGIAWLSPVGSTGLGDAAIRDGDLVRMHYDQSQPETKDLYVRGIWGDGLNMMFVGDRGKIFTYAVGSDDVAEVPSPTDSTLGGIWGSSLSDVWIVGDRELVMHGAFP